MIVLQIIKKVSFFTCDSRNIVIFVSKLTENYGRKHASNYPGDNSVVR